MLKVKLLNAFLGIVFLSIFCFTTDLNADLAGGFIGDFKSNVSLSVMSEGLNQVIEENNNIESNSNIFTIEDRIVTDFRELESIAGFITGQLFRNHELDPEINTDDLGTLGEEIINPIRNLFSDTVYLKELIQAGDVRITRKVENINNEEGKAVLITNVLKLKDDSVTLTFMPVWQKDKVFDYSQHLFSMEITDSSSETSPITKGIVFNRDLRSWEDASVKTASITYSYTSPGEEKVLSAYARGSVQPLSWDLWYEASGFLFIRDPRNLFGIWGE